MSEEKVNRSVTYLLTEMMKLGMFENPYVDPKNAKQVVDNPASQEKADLAHRKSVILLRNGNNLLPLNDRKIGNVKLYVEAFPGGNNGAQTQQLKEMIRKHDPKITISDSLEGATHAFVWVKPKQDFMKRKPTLTIGAETGIPNVSKSWRFEKKVPTITAINMRSPWLINEIEPNAAAVIATFGVKTEALVDVIRGRFNPVGKLPFTIPANQEAVNNEKGDLPGFREAPTYVYRAANGDTYGYNFGLSY